MILNTIFKQQITNKYQPQKFIRALGLKISVFLKARSRDLAFKK